MNYVLRANAAKTALAVILMISLAFTVGCSMFKSDEQLIKERIESFETSYNAGDTDGLLECFDKNTRTMMSSVLGIGDSLLGGLTGVDISLSDLFGLGMGLMDYDMLTVEEISDIRIDDDSAEADAAIVFKNPDGEEYTLNGTISLVKEDGNWYINNLT